MRTNTMILGLAAVLLIGAPAWAQNNNKGGMHGGMGMCPCMDGNEPPNGNQ